MKFIGRWLAATVILTALLVVTGSVMPAVDVEPAPGLLPWMLASNALIAACIVGLAALTPWNGAPLAAALFAVLFGVNAFTSLIEAYFFHVLGGRATAVLLAQDAVVYALFAAAVAWLSRSRQPAEPRRAWTTDVELLASTPLWRFAVVAALYVAFYFTAGMLVFPFVRTFYEGKVLPPPMAIVAMQLFVRAPMFAVLIALIVRMLQAPRLVRALAVGLTLSLVGGGAALILPNPFFPDAVRLAHLVEVGTSNFVFGMLAAWILSAPPRAALKGCATDVLTADLR